MEDSPKKKNRPSTSSSKMQSSEEEHDKSQHNTSASAANKEAPYGAEYAKSGRATCKGCKETIAKDSLRMAVRFPSKFFDGMQENWHHFECFWKKARKNDINETSIRGMDWLKWEDQEKIRQRIDELKEGGEYTPKTASIKVEHAKSAAGKCFTCKEKIEKGQLRIACRASFHHVKCFQTSEANKKSGEEFVGYNELNDEEKAEIDQYFPKPQTEDGKKHKLENEDTSGTPIAKKAKVEDDESTRNALKKQSETLWNTREQLKEKLHADEIESLLQANGNYKSKKGGLEGMLDKLVDMVVFGTPAPCPDCGKGPLNYNTDLHAYRCSGYISEYSHCMHTTRKPERVRFRIPSEMKKNNEFLQTLKTPVLKERVYPAAALHEEIIPESKAFKHLNFASRSLKEGTSKSTKKGAGASSSGGSQRMVIKQGNVVDPKCTVAETTHVFIDPETKRPWQANLSSVDVATGRNSYYKLQIVKDDHGSRYYLFRSWGRVGTSIGGSKTEEFKTDLELCQETFEKLFYEKTHNSWEDYIAGKFGKRPGGMDILDVDFSDKKANKKMQKLDVESSKSKLPREVKELISMVFDLNTLTDTMKEFEIDMEKMPLGRLSRKHILKAYQVLTDLQQVLENQENKHTSDAEENPPNRHTFMELTNRFYTFIPHATGLKNPPLLNNMKILKEKTEMLDSLLEIEIAYNILKSDYEELDSDQKDAFDLHYERLKCSMEVLDQGSDEFAMVKRYLENTHASTHEIQLEIVNVLKVERDEEVKRFKKGIGNRHLLWHGSRLSNYAGILSQGLRIAPPEAPVTGYMFGKGIYTADMVTKSANYCYVMSGEGLLLLCDVALGDVQMEKDAKDIKKPKRGKNSVKGLGGTFPNPAENQQLGDLTVPCGKPIKSTEKNLSLLYNEYIVYDEAQVQLRYIVRVKFNNKLL